jgi:hypothetical protein
VAAGNRPVDDGNGPPVLRLNDAALGLVASYRGDNLGMVFFDFDREPADFVSIADDVAQGGARFHDIARQTVEFDIAIIAKYHTLGIIEHDQALRHVVERNVEHPAFAGDPAIRNNEKSDNQSAGGYRKPNWRKVGQPQGALIDGLCAARNSSEWAG